MGNGKNCLDLDECSRFSEWIISFNILLLNITNIRTSNAGNMWFGDLLKICIWTENNVRIESKLNNGQSKTIDNQWIKWAQWYLLLLKISPFFNLSNYLKKCRNWFETALHFISSQLICPHRWWITKRPQPFILDSQL